MSKLETNTIDTVSGTTNLTIGSTNTSTITMPNGALSGQNYPAFEAYLNTSQTVGDSATTKVPFEVEVFDTDNCYDNTTNYRFTPTVAGKYYVYANVMQDGGAGLNNIYSQRILIYKNGSEYKRTLVQYQGNPIRQAGVLVYSVLDMNGSSDYLEIYQNINTVNGNNGVVEPDSVSKKGCTFGAYRIGA